MLSIRSAQPPGLRTCLTVLAILGSSACSDDPEPDAKPNFESTRCRYELGEGQVEGKTVQCGDLIVPSRRDGEPASEFRLHVLRFGARRLSVAPIVYLEGGPGGDVAGIASLPLEITQQITSTRDFIVFSQRGTGKSLPLADCPEPKQILPVGNPDVEEFEDAIDAAFLECRDRLIAEGVDLAALSSRENADDVDDLRRALGYDQINLLGGSYGSRLALEIMRRHGPTVRAAVIDAIAPPNTPWVIQGGMTFQAALTELLAICEQTATCKAAFGSPTQLAAAAFEELESQPLVLPNAGVTLYGHDILAAVFSLMYNEEALSGIPLLLAAARDRNVSVLEQLGADPAVTSNGGGTAVGMQTSVNCNDQAQFLTGSDVDAAFVGLRSEIVASFKRHLRGDVERCRVWPLATPDPGQMDAVTSTIPTLVMSGKFDPVTPPRYGDLVMKTLSNARHVVFPTGAHGALSNDCGRGLTFGFFDDPVPQQIDASCAASASPLVFKLK
jgi:pimeloyl-ACP methyl ester carboxylesterase